MEIAGFPEPLSDFLFLSAAFVNRLAICHYTVAVVAVVVVGVVDVGVGISCGVAVAMAPLAIIIIYGNSVADSYTR